MSDRLVPPLEWDFRDELRDLRRGLLPKFAVGLFTIYWIWYMLFVQAGKTLFFQNATGPIDVALLIASAALGFVFLFRHRHFALSLMGFSLGFALAIRMSVGYMSASLFWTLNLLIVMAAATMLGAVESFVAAILVWGIQMAAVYAGIAPRMPTAEVFGALGMYFLVCLSVWVAYDPLETVSRWALDGWARSQDTLGQVRERRGELYRVVRALEEATYRVERMNNELMLAREQAEAAKANKARFVATVSHELRGPLNLVLGFSRLMVLSPERYGELLPGVYRADMDTIYSSTQHLVALLDDILDLSQIEADHLPLIKDRVDLEKDVIEEAVSIVRPLLERKGLDLKLSLAGDLPEVLADQVRLRQVLLNVLTNAARFTDQGGVTVRTFAQQDHILISIQDTGRGIPAQDLSRLFEEFQQLHTGDEKATKGTGLGLTISKRFVQLHGGQMWAESQEGIGTTIYFTVPLPSAESADWRTIRTPERVSRPRPYDTCLVVHHDPGIVKLLARYIEDRHVVGLPNENEVATFALELHPRAIIVAPDSSETVLRQLSSLPMDIPVITCGIPSLAKRSPTEGTVRTYLMKPITPEMIQVAMKQLDLEGNVTVLLVDDDPDAVRLLEIMLTSLPRSYRILRAYNGIQALEIMKEVTPGVVFMDLLMPGLDGEQTIAQMRADPRLRNVSVVMISASDPAEHPAVLETPVTVYCRQPLHFAEGCRLLNAMLNALEPHYLLAPGIPAPSPEAVPA